jgi:tetratricopeptide (TPR) repeat protein
MKFPVTIAAVLLIVVFALIVAVLQYPGLHARMYYDSVVRIAGNEPIYKWKGFGHALKTFPQRPLPIISFYANYLIGGMKPAYFRVVNFVLLALTAFVLVLLVSLILDLPGPWTNAREFDKKSLSILLGLVFLVHPLQTYTTLYIWQRMALMSCLFYFLSFTVYLATRSGRIKNAILGYGACFLFFVCAMLSKENSVTLPGALILAEIMLIKSSWKNIFARSAIFLVIVLLILVPLSWLQHPHGKEHLGSGFLSTIALYYQQSHVKLMEVLLTQSRALFLYLSIIFFPSPDRAQLLHPFVISRSLVEPWITLPAVIGAAGLIVLTIYLVRKRPLSGFGLAFFFMNMIPEFILVPQYAFFGYRAILPMFGLLIIVADVVLAVILTTKAQGARNAAYKVVYVILGIWIVGCGWVTVSRAIIWNDPVKFWRGVVDELPDEDTDLERRVSSQALNNLGVLTQRQGKDREGLIYIQRAVRLSPGKAFFHSSLGAAYLRIGEDQKAETALKKALELDPELVHAHYTIGILYAKQGRKDEALKHFLRVEELSPYNSDIRKTVGEILLKRGHLTGAKTRFQRGVELDPDSPVLQYDFGLTLLNLGNIADSVDHLRKAVELKPDYWQAYNNLGVAFARIGRLEEAVEFFRKALNIKPDDEATKRNLDMALKQLQSQKNPPQ